MPVLSKKKQLTFFVLTQSDKGFSKLLKLRGDLLHGTNRLTEIQLYSFHFFLYIYKIPFDLLCTSLRAKAKKKEKKNINGWIEITLNNVH